jgi:uncharacterized protein
LIIDSLLIANFLDCRFKTRLELAARSFRSTINNLQSTTIQESQITKSSIDCLGSDNAERSYQPRLIALPIVPDYVKEPACALRATARQAHN